MNNAGVAGGTAVLAAPGHRCRKIRKSCDPYDLEVQPRRAEAYVPARLRHPAPNESVAGKV